MHYYQHHIGDFVRDTSRLTDAQCMAYLRLIWMYYDTEKPLPDDPEGLAFQVGASDQDVRLILKHYFEIDGNLHRHKRCDKEIADYHSKKEKAAKSANARWNNPNAMRTHTERIANERVLDANQEPRTKNHKEKATVVATPEGVSPEIWDAFVQHRKRKKADITPLVMSYIVEQAKIAGWTLDNVLKEICARSWTSFKAEWVANKPGYVKPITQAEISTNRILGRPADQRLLTPEEQAERQKRIAMR
jgi:uncharacterized protein YdaU (DUF1376 family)